MEVGVAPVDVVEVGVAPVDVGAAPLPRVPVGIVLALETREGDDAYGAMFQEKKSPSGKEW